MSTAVERLQADLDLVLQISDEEFEDPSELSTLLKVVTQMRTNVTKAEKESLSFLSLPQINEWRRSVVESVKAGLGVELTNWELPERTTPVIDRQMRDMAKLRELLCIAIAKKSVKEISSLFKLIKASELNIQNASLASSVLLNKDEALAVTAEWFNATYQQPEIVAAVEAAQKDPDRSKRFDAMVDHFLGRDR